MAYWKYVIRRRLLGEKKGTFPLKGSNWFNRPLGTSARAWREDLALLDQCHRRLREAVESVRERDLPKRLALGRFTIESTIRGSAFHDVYHAGQIQLLKRLVRS